jgi:hypothetical protein
MYKIINVLLCLMEEVNVVLSLKWTIKIQL